MRIDLEMLSQELKELSTAVHGVQDTKLWKVGNVGEQLFRFAEVRALLLWGKRK